MAINRDLTCPVCGSKTFEAGEMSTKYDKESVRFRVRTSVITSDWEDVYAQKCSKCRYILLFAT